MSSALAAPASAGAVPGDHSPWLIALVVSIATFMEVLDISIANVALRHIAGALPHPTTKARGSHELPRFERDHPPDQRLVVDRFGRKRFYMSVRCHLHRPARSCAGSHGACRSLIMFRVLQGLGGGGLAPSEQAILADAFPPTSAGRPSLFYGIAVVAGSAIGPTLGGWITDTASWHWIFFINVPMGIISLILVSLLVREPAATEDTRRDLSRPGVKVDFIGFILVALGLGCLEVVLDEGQRNDWFSSDFIVTFAIVSGVALALLVPWELSRKHPIVDLRLIGRRQFGTCFFVMLLVGAILISTTQLIPQLLQTQFGYTATLAGMALSPGGAVVMMLMPLAGWLTDKMQPKYLIAFGLTVIALSMWIATNLNGDVTFAQAAWARVLTAAGLPFLFIPITAASYSGLPPGSTNQAAGLINVARNLGVASAWR